METGWIWFWYVLIVIVVWLLLSMKCTGSTLSSGVAFTVAAIFGLLFGLILIPFFVDDYNDMSDGDRASLTVFVVVALLLPIIGMIYIGASGEYLTYWNSAMKGMSKGSIYATNEFYKQEACGSAAPCDKPAPPACHKEKTPSCGSCSAH